ncbi:hypothetical protein K6119_02450 [Paracrocinitomix mangrovi]|uniref:hypothetical protein n=1 Tax=Paracrocinitomix mangrovi TaxID=2862509 RepID=UPI001C8E81C5|nr:hypothetical protein [Paracrocinitomix mangrovi]UKN02381.1 hypothetical protein K6119_02450 [Paracrocinitomix mangrovi]
MKTIIVVLAVCLFSLSAIAQQDRLEGNWLGIDMYQDANTYDGKNYFLPNEEFIVIEDNKIKIYFYPYSKSDEFEINVKGNTIHHEVGRKRLETDYSFTNENCDTLVFTMHFINKTFVKMYHRITSTNKRFEVDFATLKELDQYGFNPSSITHLFEVDTFHNELYFGFNNYSQLGFIPYEHLQFINDQTLSINRTEVVDIERGYKTIRFEIGGVPQEFRVEHSEGTQSFTITPLTLCQCDSIRIPYITVDWADRIRKDMKENAYKYRKSE